MITASNTEQSMSLHIRNMVGTSGLTKKYIYNTLGMSRETFDSRLMNPFSFTYRNLMRLAEALRVEVPDLFPAHNQDTAKLAG